MKATQPSLENIDTFNNIPFYSQSVAAGFPSPADDFLEFDLSLDKKLIITKQIYFNQNELGLPL